MLSLLMCWDALDLPLEGCQSRTIAISLLEFGLLSINFDAGERTSLVAIAVRGRICSAVSDLQRLDIHGVRSTTPVWLSSCPLDSTVTLRASSAPGTKLDARWRLRVKTRLSVVDCANNSAVEHVYNALLIPIDGVVVAGKKANVS